MAQLIGATNSNKVLTPTFFKSVLITSGAGVSGAVSIYAGSDTSAPPLVTLKAPQSETAQYFFDDVPCPDGLTVVPTADVSSYLVEYGDK